MKPETVRKLLALARNTATTVEERTTALETALRHIDSTTCESCETARTLLERLNSQIIAYQERAAAAESEAKELREKVNRLEQEKQASYYVNQFRPRGRGHY